MYLDCEALTGVLVEDTQQLERAAVGGLIEDKVVGPDAVRLWCSGKAVLSSRSDAGAVCGAVIAARAVSTSAVSASVPVTARRLHGESQSADNFDWWPRVARGSADPSPSVEADKWLPDG